MFVRGGSIEVYTCCIAGMFVYIEEMYDDVFVAGEGEQGDIGGETLYVPAHHADGNWLAKESCFSPNNRDGA